MAGGSWESWGCGRNTHPQPGATPHFERATVALPGSHDTALLWTRDRQGDPVFQKHRHYGTPGCSCLSASSIESGWKSLPALLRSDPQRIQEMWNSCTLIRRSPPPKA